MNHFGAEIANDNIDINEENLDGKGTFHASQSAAFIKKTDCGEESAVNIKFSNRRAVKVSLTLSELKDSNVGTKKAEPVFQSNVDLTLYEPNQAEIKKAEAKDLAWLLAMMVNPKDQNVPGWSGFSSDHPKRIWRTSHQLKIHCCTTFGELTSKHLSGTKLVWLTPSYHRPLYVVGWTVTAFSNQCF